MVQLTLTVASVGDAARLLPMMEEFNRLEEIDVDPGLHRRALAKLLAGPELGLVFLFAADDVVVGYAVVTYNYDLEYAGRDAFLTELFIASPARGQGFGREMLERIERALAAHEVKALHLMVRPENTIAQRLYVRSGYSPAPRITLGKQLV